MNLSLKSTTSILVLTLCLTASAVYSADHHPVENPERQSSPSLLSVVPPSAARDDRAAIESAVVQLPRIYSSLLPTAVVPTSKRETLSPSTGVKVQVLKDTFPDSGSMSMLSSGDLKSKVQETLSQASGHHDKRLMLQLDGGGVRGMLSILQLCVLEEIINLPENEPIREQLLVKKRERLAKTGQKDDITRLYIRDLFDIGSGVSTGAILLVGLFSEKNYFATDVAKLYTRFGYKTFDEQKRSAMPLGIGLTCATFDNAGLKKLLLDHFGNAHLSHVHKPIYIVALNENKQEAAIFSTEHLKGDELHLERTPLVDAVLYSASAPTFLPGVSGITDKGSMLFSDGGTVANNSAHLVYKKEILTHHNPYGIFSLGTGIPPTATIRSADSGALAVAQVLTNTLIASEKLALSQCIDEIQAPSQLQYFVRINPILEPGMDRLDDTSEAYVKYAIGKAFSVTKGAVFADAVQHLGFFMPGVDGLRDIHMDILKKLYALQSSTYSELTDLEKEFVIRKVIGLDFKFYELVHFYNKASSKIEPMNDTLIGVFLTDLMNDVARKKAAENPFLLGLWSKITTSDADKIQEFIPRCMEFHTLTKGKNLLTADDLAFLTTEIACEFTQEQLRSLSPGHTINGDGAVYSGSKAVDSPANGLATRLFTTFVEYCESETATYKYMDSSSPYAHLPALIYWKNILQNIEGRLTKQQLEKMRDNLKGNLSQIIGSRTYTAEWLARIVRSSRHEVLLKGLDAYIAKFHKD